jgi:hypothetical protein
MAMLRRRQHEEPTGGLPARGRVALNHRGHVSPSVRGVAPPFVRIQSAVPWIGLDRHHARVPIPARVLHPRPRPSSSEGAGRHGLSIAARDFAGRN